MTPAARAQAAIEILDLVIDAAREGGAAADTIVQRYFSTRRYAGGGDRRGVRALVFGAIRSLGELPASGRAALIGYLRAEEPEMLALFGSGGHAPAGIEPDEPEAAPGLAPAWLVTRLRGRFGADIDAELAGLLGRAPLDLRVNILKASRADVIASLPEAEALPWPDTALRLPSGTAVDAMPAFEQGLVEVQDAGSQLAAAIVDAQPGQTVIDLCAGAGGKTLALAAAMDNRGRIIATDSDRGRLSAMEPRLARAGVSIVERRLLDGNRETEALQDLVGVADRVIVDAPCSGSGTWRRNPESRWRLSPHRLTRLVYEQARLLWLAAHLVRPGGRLVYVVCSLVPEEAEGQVAALLREWPQFQRRPFESPAGEAPLGQLVLSPARHGCDGFFIATLERIG
ncbi:RsmB/NOP family class I SAM-dependent RNA methyltransferase [Polymorphobacter sp.]|uniref:RsmB/NOP family class I SAM-dependent RNA methyltransferase n=1 Tax=Polymorphobacter sp. TaxID=1909290 RepID=UPI003F725423